MYKSMGADSEYANRILRSSPGNITTLALQNRSASPRDVLARAASLGKCDADELVTLIKTLQRKSKSPETKEFIGSLQVKPLLSLATVLANQAFNPLDEYDSIALFKASVGHHKPRSLSKNERLILLEMLASKRWVKDLEKYLSILKIADYDKAQPKLLMANALNPFKTGGEDQSSAQVSRWLEIVNETLAMDDLEPIQIAPGEEAPLDRIICAASSFVTDGPLVTVIIPTFDPGPRIETAVESLISQSYTNLQILIMDDATPSERASNLDKWAARDSRISVIHLPENAGTYRARNIAVSQYAKGEFITVHDDDDWSHPRKIELQVNQLMKNSDSLANVSMLSRATDNLVFARINNNPVFTQKNYSSMMIRRQVFEDFGYWDVVNRSADAEMYDRIVSVTGRQIPIAGSVPTSFLRIRAASLTSGEIHKGYIDDRRRWYQRLSRAWHDSCVNQGITPYVSLDYPTPRPFPAPVGMIGSKQRPIQIEVDIVYATDFRFPGGNSSLAVQELRILKEAGKRVALLQLDSPLLGPSKKIHPGVVDLLQDGQIQIVSLLDEVHTKLTLVRHPTVLQYPRVERSRINTDNVVVIVNHAPHETDLGGSLYDVSDVINNAATIFGTVPMISPESGLIRQLLGGLCEPSLMTKHNWEGTVQGVSEFPLVPAVNRRPIIGRHSRDAELKWPESDVLRQVYPVDGSFDIRVLGGADWARSKLETSDLGGWTVYEFGSRDVGDFLREIDFWVYFHSTDLHESFGMSTAEAMAAGLVVILPKYMRPTFGTGAVYAEPEEVVHIIESMWADPAEYSLQSRRALDWASEHFGSDALLDRVEQFFF